MERNKKENFSMEWKKIAKMEYGKFVFHFMPANAQKNKNGETCMYKLIFATLNTNSKELNFRT